MHCHECSGLAVQPDKTKKPERVFLGYPYHNKDAFGTWLYPTKSVELCSYHRRKREGHFDRPEEYYRKNRGPYEWTQYGR